MARDAATTGGRVLRRVRSRRGVQDGEHAAGRPGAADKDKGTPPALDEDDIKLLKTYGVGPYASNIKKFEEEVKDLAKKVNELRGIKESDTGLAVQIGPRVGQEACRRSNLQVARCTKITILTRTTPR